MSGEADPRPPRRRKDLRAVRKARLLADECVVCEKSDEPLNMHHVLYGADGRHDDPRNLLPLCGSGTTGCHGFVHAADYETLLAVGRALAADPERIRFVEERLGKERAEGYLYRRYGLVLSGGVTPDPRPEKKK